MADAPGNHVAKLPQYVQIGGQAVETPNVTTKCCQAATCPAKVSPHLPRWQVLVPPSLVQSGTVYGTSSPIERGCLVPLLLGNCHHHPPGFQGFIRG